MKDLKNLQIDDKYAYRIPLKCFCDLGKINLPTKIDLKIRCTLKTDMKKIFESKKMLKPLKLGATVGSTTATNYAPATSPGVPDAQIIFFKSTFYSIQTNFAFKRF